MDPIDFSENFYDDDLISVGDRMLRDIRLPGFHRRWATHEYLLKWHELRERGEVGWPALPARQPGELRPLYLGIASPTPARAEQRDIGKERREWFSPFYTMSKSLGNIPVWNEHGSLAEAKALLLYAHKIILFDPLDDFIDRFVVDSFGARGVPRSSSVSRYHIVEECLAIREGISYERLTSKDRNLLKICIVRLIYFLGRFKPFIRCGLVCVLPRPRQANLGVIRRDLCDILGRRQVRLEALPRHEVRALLLARSLEALNGIDAYSPSTKELSLAQTYLGRETSTSEPERLGQIVSARLPNLDTLAISDFVSIRDDDDFVAWRKLLREILSNFAAGQDALAIEALDASAADLRNRWREQLATRSFALAISAAISAPMGARAIAGGIAGVGAGVAAEASVRYRRKRAIRHHIISLSGISALPLVFR